VDGNSELYERAAEAGGLEETVGEIFQEDEYLSQMGADADEVDDAEDRAIEAEHQNKSQEEIILEAVETQNSPDRDDIATHAEQSGLDREKALDLLDKYREMGEIGGTYDGPFRVY
jgi:hypothetical protein